MYEKFFKRLIDLTLSVIALLVLFPVFIVLIIIGSIKMKGNPFFTQPRPGQKGKDGKERIFKLIKFRTMSNERDKDGKLLPDEQRLNKYGVWLRSTSLDELPSLINIIFAQLSIVGPRPQLVRDMTFMTEEQRRRHDVRPGLTGLAQINGRGHIPLQDRINYDLEYIDTMSAWLDIKILWKTIWSVLIKDHGM